MKNAIISASDARFGDFSVHHWVASLKANVDLDKTEIVLMDYGFSDAQKKALAKEPVTVVPCTRDGHVVCLRLRDIAAFLEKNRFDQVMATDGGDVIFQSDLKELFDFHPQELRAVCEDFNMPFDQFLAQNNFSKENVQKIQSFLKGKPMINAGMFIGPHDKFLDLCKKCDALIENKYAWGPDQIALNYWLYKLDFVPAPSKFNFVITTCEEPFSIRNGEFFLSNGERIPIVHNAGGHHLMRPVKNFGFGPSYNRMRIFRYWGMRFVTRIVHLFFQQGVQKL